MTIAATVEKLLDQETIPYAVIQHRDTESSTESAEAASIPDDHLAKAVVLSDEKGVLLVVIPADRWVAVHRVQEELDRPVDLAPEHAVDRLFPDCRPGAIPPFGAAYGIATLLDEALTSLAKVYFEAGDHRHLIGVSGRHFRSLMGGARHGYFCTGD